MGMFLLSFSACHVRCNRTKHSSCTSGLARGLLRPPVASPRSRGFLPPAPLTGASPLRPCAAGTAHHGLCPMNPTKGPSCPCGTQTKALRPWNSARRTKGAPCSRGLAPWEPYQGALRPLVTPALRVGNSRAPGFSDPRPRPAACWTRQGDSPDPRRRLGRDGHSWRAIWRRAATNGSGAR